MQAQQGSAAAQFQKLPPAHLRQAREHQQDETGEQHAIPHNIDLVQRDQFAKQTRKACQQHAEMQLQEAFLRFVHDDSVFDVVT